MPEADTRPTSGYLRNGLMWQQRATAEGIPLKGNFVWSAMELHRRNLSIPTCQLPASTLAPGSEWLTPRGSNFG